MELLVIRMSAMGDVAMTVPVVDSLLSQNKDINITFVSNPKFEAFFPKRDNFTFVGFDTKKEYKGLRGIFKIFKVLKSEKRYDAIIDLHDVLRSKIIRFLFKLFFIKNYVIDKGRNEKKALTKAENKRLIRLKTSVERYTEVFNKAGLSFSLNFKPIIDKSEPLPENIVDITGKKDCKWLAIAPFAQHKGKIYPIEKMGEVINTLSKKENLKIFLFGGGKNEATIMNKWAEKSENVISLAGKFKMNEELQIMAHSDIMLSMDSSNMHLASLVGTPVVSVWGATHIYAGFYGFGQDEGNIIQEGLECRPCSVYGNKPCIRGDYACMNNISPQRIISKIETILF